MGFFSKVCSKTHLPVVHEMRGYPRLQEVVALAPDGRVTVGLYDGYGNVGGVDMMDEWDDTKFVLKWAYDNDKYADLAKSQNEMGQGHFMSDLFLDFCDGYAYNKKGLKSHKEYKDAFKKLAGW